MWGAGNMGDEPSQPPLLFVIVAAPMIRLDPSNWNNTSKHFTVYILPTLDVRKKLLG